MKKIKYRKINFITSDNRDGQNIWLHPALIDGLKKIAKNERKSVSWVVENALSDYFGIEVLLRKLKGKPTPAVRISDNVRYKRRAS